MLGNLNGIHLLVLVLVILLLFGAPKLPALARSMGQSMRIFRKEVQTMNSEKAEAADRRGSHPESEADVVGGDAAASTSSMETVTGRKQ